MALIRKSTKLLALRPTIDSFSQCLRMNASIWSVLAGKYRLFVHGTEKPIPKWKPRQPDSILEELYKINPSIVPYEKRTEAKHYYMQWKSHQKIIEHNKRIRKLDQKIKKGLYDNWDYANKW